MYVCHCCCGHAWVLRVAWILASCRHGCCFYFARRWVCLGTRAGCILYRSSYPAKKRVLRIVEIPMISQSFTGRW